MSKLFTIAGTSVLAGVRTYRFANGSVKVRVGVLRRNDHSEIELFELPEAMSKDVAIQWLSTQGIEAIKPVTGRAVGTPIDPEVLAQQAREAAERAAEQAAAEAAQAAADAEWINTMAA
jgi:hypothetical protein